MSLEESRQIDFLVLCALGWKDPVFIPACIATMADAYWYDKTTHEEHPGGFATDWRAAGELFEQMLESVVVVNLLAIPDEPDHPGEYLCPGRYMCYLEYPLGNKIKTPWAPTGPEAIARAFLAWKERECQR